MGNPNTSTRRRFLQSGALLGAPLAVGAIPAAGLAGDGANTRLEHLEQQAAIRAVHEDWLRQLNAGARDARLDPCVRRILCDHAGAADRIEIAADGHTAVGRFEYLLDLERVLPREGTLAQMAHAQGHGTRRATERRTLTVHYEKVSGAWRVRSSCMA